MSKVKVGLFSGEFFEPQKCMSLMEQNAGLQPSNVEYIRDKFLDINVYTDTRLTVVDSAPSGVRNIAWLHEPPPFRTKHYDYAIKNSHKFDYILTYRPELVRLLGLPFVEYRQGGSRVSLDDWRVYGKNKLVSFVASKKNVATGHKFRHEIYNTYKDKVDTFGGLEGGDRVQKIDAIRDYMFTVIVPGERTRGLFCCHILDCFSTGTIPIYWKPHDIGKYFDMSGIIGFEHLDELGIILDRLTHKMYQEKIESAKANLETAIKYRCTTDWLFENRRFLFE